jgi:DNA-binding IclR family transcriptional regulator
MHLTVAQVVRLSGLDDAMCRRVLDDLVRARFLCVRPDHRYARWIDDPTT